jgi:hypothetical protein
MVMMKACAVGVRGVTMSNRVYTPKLYWRIKNDDGKWTWVPAKLIYDHVRTGIRSDGTPWTLKGDRIYRVAPHDD